MNTPAKKQDNLSTTIYDKMRMDILDGELEAGGKLGMSFLQNKYTVGNSPIREALNRLVSDGLVVREAGKGFKVQRLSRANLSEITELRCLLEDFALRKSIQVGGAEWEDNLVIAHHRLSKEPRHDPQDSNISSRKWEQLHQDYHLALLSAYDSKLLTDHCKNLSDLAERYRRNSLAVSSGARNSKDEHSQIMTAAIDRNTELASKLLHEHMQYTRDSIIEALPDD